MADFTLSSKVSSSIWVPTVLGSVATLVAPATAAPPIAAATHPCNNMAPAKMNASFFSELGNIVISFLCLIISVSVT